MITAPSTFIPTASYSVHFAGSMYGIVSGATATAMAANGSKATFVLLTDPQAVECAACNAEPGEPCRVGCIGQAAHDEQDDDECADCANLPANGYDGCPEHRSLSDRARDGAHRGA